MPKRILTCSPKGGCGKTSLTRNLAVAAALQNRKVTVVDLDPQRTLVKWWARRSEHLASIDSLSGEMTDAEDVISEVTGGDLVLIDTPPSLEIYPEHAKILIQSADLILVPCRATIDDVDSVVPFMGLFRSHGAEATVVLNAVKSNLGQARIKKHKARILAAGHLCPIEIADRVDYPGAAEDGLGVLEVKRAQAAAEEIMGLWDFVSTQLWSKRHAA